MKLENIFNAEFNIKNALKLVGGIGLATALYFGSIHRTDGCFPFYTKITGKNYGIAAGLRVDVKKDAEMNGIVVAIGGKNEGKINGLRAGLINYDNKEINGISIGLGNLKGSLGYFNGVQIGLVNLGNDSCKVPPTTQSKGFECGFLNLETNNVKGIQIGLFNSFAYTESESDSTKYKSSFIINSGL